MIETFRAIGYSIETAIADIIDNSITAGVSGGQRVVISGSASPFIIYGTDGTTKLLEYVTGGTTGSLAIKGSGTFTGSLEIGTGNNIFKADGATGIWLGNSTFESANFRVSTSGILTALAGNIGGWTISPSQFKSNGTDYISLAATTPKISIVKASTPNDGSITIDPVDGIKGTNFQVTPSGDLTATNAQFTGGKITVNAGASNVIQIGKDVNGTDVNGIYINTNNYWYGTGRFSVGDATNNVVWDNAKLAVTGEVNATSGKFGGATNYWTIGTNGITSTASAVINLSTGGTIKVGNYDIKSNGTDFTITQTVSGTVTNLIKTESVTGATADPLRIFLGDTTRQVEVAKSAQVSGNGTPLQFSANPTTTDQQNANNQYRSGGLRNMYTVSFGNASSAIYPSAVTGDILLVYNPTIGL
jgi:hypothetical protein